MRADIGKMQALDAAVEMSEGNPGAITVLKTLLCTTAWTRYILDFDDMNMRGPQIWVAFKYHCEGDYKKLIQCLESRDVALVDRVNKEMVRDRFKWKAVTSGASAMKDRPVLESYAEVHPG